MNKFILLALVAGLAQGASLADLNDSTELTDGNTIDNINSTDGLSCKTAAEKATTACKAQGASLADVNDSTELTACTPDSSSQACIDKDIDGDAGLKKADADFNKAGGDIVGTIIGIVVGVCCLCCVLPLVVWCMFFKAAVDIAEANQQPMLGGGETVVVVEEGGL